MKNSTNFIRWEDKKPETSANARLYCHQPLSLDPKSPAPQQPQQLQPAATLPQAVSQMPTQQPMPQPTQFNPPQPVQQPQQDSIGQLVQNYQQVLEQYKVFSSATQPLTGVPQLNPFALALLQAQVLSNQQHQQFQQLGMQLPFFQKSVPPRKYDCWQAILTS